MLGKSRIRTPERVQEALSSLAAIGKHCCEEDLSRLDGPDPYEQELLVMAEVMAYFKVTFKVGVAIFIRHVILL